jgi:multidrug efflux system membrane fusion protein
MKLPIADCRLPIGNSRRAGAFLCAALVALAVAGCKREDAQAASAERPPAAVMVAEAVTREVPVYLDQIGRTVAVESVTIQPQVAGRVTEVHFTDGADVKKGQLLFTIDPRPFKAAVAEAEAELAENRATLKYAQDELKRLEGVKGTGAVSQQEYEKNVNAAAVAAAQVDAAQAKVDTAKLNLEYCTIESPIDGRAGERLVDPGNVVQGGGMQGGTQLLVVQTLDPIYADFTVTENEFGTVRKFMAEGRLPGGDPQGKMKVLVDIPGDARQVIEAVGGAAPATQPAPISATAPATRPAGAGPREGLLTFLDNAVQSATGTVRLRATLPNQDRYFWPGQFVNVRLVLTVKPNAVLVPAMAQQIGQQGPYVFVVHQGTIKDPATGKETTGTIASLRPIRPGQRQGNMLVIDQGLEPGEQVITQGHMSVMPGGPVMVIPSQGGAPGGAAPSGTAGANGASAGAAAPNDAGAGAASGDESEKKS